MVLRAITRTAALDGLDLYRRLDAANPESLVSDPTRVEAVMSDIREKLHQALSTPSTVRGWRAQALFASMVAALDGCVMLTQVDLGEVFVDGDSVKAPDFFLHLRDGRRILVDVKSIGAAPVGVDSWVSFGASEVERLRRFGDLYGASVYFAVYFPALPIWTLLSLDDLSRGPGGGYRVSFADAMKRNRIAVIGDLTIGVEPPLELVLHADPARPRLVDDEGKASFTVGAVDVFAGGKPVQSKEARRIVLFLMLYGGWPQIETPKVQGSTLLSVSWRAEPEQVANPGEHFEMVGSLASMYARLFELGTTGPDGVTGLDIAAEPGSLVSLIPHDYESDDLRLWRFELVPSEAAGNE